MPKISQFSPEQVSAAKAYAAMTPPDDLDPRIEALVNDLIGRVADKWTMLILEVLAEKGELRFTRLSELVDFRQADFRYKSALNDRIVNNALVESAPRS